MGNLTIQLSEELMKRLSDLAEKTSQTKSQYARKALELHLAEEADNQEAMRRLRDSDDETITEDELRRRLGL